ncbi:hypothetical protein G7A66_03920 [Altererythrobacter sp. SALINAS58]|uniref:putative 2OG-Fe(II) oxygenase n=1 Tax=Alteripontixanthobacter muriae TaxID=2705546 RepID=UPI001575FA1E|nr:putative 2OG-Fe(II) oxygenase [Alteripontixanthobacter muriae]NTZ42255.1 hypothetical protein [Alteripontixanthobacter muriae]
MNKPSPLDWRNRAVAAARDGREAEARSLLQKGLALHPRSAELWNSGGNLLMQLKDYAGAEQHFGQARDLAPERLEFLLNHAISMSRQDKNEAALALLRRHQAEGENDVRYCSARAAAARSSASLNEAAIWYDKALALDDAHARALHGRARVALERGEEDAPQRFERALAVNRGEADLWLGRAQALDVAGDTAGARQIAEALVQQAPQWLEALRALAQFRLAAGEADFASHFDAAQAARPALSAIAIDHTAVLASMDLFEQAAEVAARAKHRFAGDASRFALLEATHAGAAGDNERAERIFSDLETESGERYLQEARHRIRLGEFARAEQLLERVLAEQPEDIAAWALRDIVWRVTDDARSEWLHGQPEVVRMIELDDWQETLPPAIALLDELHDKSALPLGQSLRGGTQTRGLLFDRAEAELLALRRSIEKAVDRYRRSLPATDTGHPLLRHRDEAWHLAGSWSVRLSGGGDHHAGHIHPQGVVSSALYMMLPEPAITGEGWLELGRPPRDLHLDLQPLKVLQPRAGYMALFPSTLYHGTTAFTAGQRLTVAFDIVPDSGKRGT